jgi:hypothetical protein
LAIWCTAEDYQNNGRRLTKRRAGGSGKAPRQRAAATISDVAASLGTVVVSPVAISVGGPGGDSRNSRGNSTAEAKPLEGERRLPADRQPGPGQPGRDAVKGEAAARPGPEGLEAQDLGRKGDDPKEPRRKERVTTPYTRIVNRVRALVSRIR